MSRIPSSHFEELLRRHHFRVTPGRLSLLTFLSHSKKPLTARNIQEEAPYKMDKVTLYRALEDFVVSKIVAKINLHNNVTYYEYIHKDHHHHHIICEVCGKLEDIEHCDNIALQKNALFSSKGFSTITSHSLEFFGVCTSCAKK